MGAGGHKRRVVLKLSGNAMRGAAQGVFGQEALRFITAELAAVHKAGIEIAVVLGGGNVLRGARFQPEGPGRLAADYAGMLATVVNALVLKATLTQAGVEAVCYSALTVPGVVPPFEPEACKRDLAAGRIALLAGGTGNPLFTTDTAAALRAVQLEADLLLKATRVDGVYAEDPEKNPKAELFERISHQEVIRRRLGVMDLTAVSFCLEHGLAVRVFNYSVPGNIPRAAAGEAVGTLIGE